LPLRVILVRHGQSSYNVEHRIQGRDDLSVLTETGRQQASRTGAALAEVPLAAIYSSPLRRARDSADLLAAAHGSGLTPLPDEDLLEVDLSPWSGLLRTELAGRDPEGERRWLTAPETLELERADGSRYRPIPDLMEQASRFVGRLLQSHGEALTPSGGAAPDGRSGAVVVVAHNGILRCLVLHLLGRTGSGFASLRLDNASLTVLNLSRSGDGRLEVQMELLNGVAHLGVPLPVRRQGPRMLLVRHGETDWNREGRFQGQIDVPLNATGLRQAEAARRFLAPVPIDRAFTSPMARPRRTAEIILQDHADVALACSDGLREIAHGLWEGQLEQDIDAGWPQLLADWKRAPHTVQMPEGENLQEVWDRSVAAWNMIATGLGDEETVLVVAHDAVNKTILCALLGLTPADIWSIKQGNGGVTVVDYPRGVGEPAVVSCLNLTHHLGGVLDRTAAGAL
jgi:probable phosphoglycerate mutase